MEWYYILGIISYGIFIVQFLISQIGGDIDLDVDFDGNTDFDVSDLLSFKGLIHFAMGFSSWLMIAGEVTTLDLIFASLLGIGFVVFLYFIYKLCLQANSEPTFKMGEELIGETVTVYIVDEEIPTRCICILDGSRELYCASESPVKINDVKVISAYKDNKYYIK